MVDLRLPIARATTGEEDVKSRSRMNFVAIGLLVLAVASSAHGRTWHVEKDGSGDFTVIQDAVDAAADGDVI